MRTGARGRGCYQGRVRSKGLKALRGLLAVALLVGLSWTEMAGQRLGGTVGGLLIAPAEAHKAPSKLRRAFKGRGRALQAPVFPPLPHGRAFAPSLPTKKPPPLPQGLAFKPSPPSHTLVKLPPPGREKGSATSVGKVAGLPQKVLPPQPPAGGWDAVVRPTSPPGAPKAPLAKQAPPSLAPEEARRPHKSFRRFLEKLAQRRLRQEQGAAPGAKPPQPAQKSAPGTPPPGPRRLGGRWVGELLPPVGTFKQQEVLAINLTAEGLAKARAGEFEVAGRIELPGLGLTLTHLVPPPSLNAVSARERLLDLVPDGGFVLNRVYAPYRLGSGRQTGGDSAPVQQVEGKGSCPSERCFGSTLIKWQPRLAACARDLKVGIIDTGFDKAHPALAGVRYDYSEFLPDGSAKAAPHHGTGILALLAGKPDSGTPGLIPDATFLIANAFFDEPGGQPMSDTAQMVRALDWLKRSGAAVVNLSFAGPEDDLVHHAVRELTKSGAVVVAAAGNEGPGAPPGYPAGYEEVIAVTAVDRKLSAYRYAGRGAHIDLAAPGVDVWTAIPGRREGPQTGTSFAVPYVTAVVAVALSGSALAPDGDALSPKRRVLARLQGSVKSLGAHGRDPVFGEGLVQAPASCEPPAPVVTASLVGAPPDPWAGTVVRTLDSAVAKGSWLATVRAVSSEGLGH
jgi:hypothetical protein